MNNKNTKTLLIAEVGNCTYFAILNDKYIVVHASAIERALEWLARAGYQWERWKISRQ